MMGPDKIWQPNPVTVEVLAAVLWREQVVDSGTPQSVIDGRTPEAFADQSNFVREPFLRYARAAIANEENK